MGQSLGTLSPMRPLLLLPMLWSPLALAHPGADAHLSATAQEPCNQVEVSVRRSQALIDEGRLDEADAEVVRAARCGVPLQALRLPQAEIALRRGEPEQALPLVEAAVQEEPNSATALLLRARTYAALDRYEDAADDARSVARRSPTTEPWLRAAGYAKSNAALQTEILDEAINAMGPLPVLIRTAAQAQHDAGQLNRAVSTLERVEATADHLALAGDWLASSRPDRAEKSYRQALELAHESRSTPHQRALIEHIESALETLQ